MIGCDGKIQFCSQKLALYSFHEILDSELGAMGSGQEVSDGDMAEHHQQHAYQ